MSDSVDDIEVEDAIDAIGDAMESLYGVALSLTDDPTEVGNHKRDVYMNAWSAMREALILLKATGQ